MITITPLINGLFKIEDNSKNTSAEYPREYLAVHKSNGYIDIVHHYTKEVLFKDINESNISINGTFAETTEEAVTLINVVITETKNEPIDLSAYYTQAEVDQKIEDLIGGAGNAYDTLLEIQNEIQNNDTDIAGLLTSLNGYYLKTEVDNLLVEKANKDLSNLDSDLTDAEKETILEKIGAFPMDLTTLSEAERIQFLNWADINTTLANPFFTDVISGEFIVGETTATVLLKGENLTNLDINTLTNQYVLTTPNNVQLDTNDYTVTHTTINDEYAELLFDFGTLTLEVGTYAMQLYRIAQLGVAQNIQCYTSKTTNTILATELETSTAVPAESIADGNIIHNGTNVNPYSTATRTINTLPSGDWKISYDTVVNYSQKRPVGQNAFSILAGVEIDGLLDEVDNKFILGNSQTSSVYATTVIYINQYANSSGSNIFNLKSEYRFSVYSKPTGSVTEITRIDKIEIIKRGLKLIAMYYDENGYFIASAEENIQTTDNFRFVFHSKKEISYDVIVNQRARIENLKLTTYA